MQQGCCRLYQFRSALCGRCGNLVERQSLFLKELAELRYLFLGRHIAFVRCDYLRALRKIFGEVCKFLVYLFEVIAGISALNAGHVNNMHDKPAALHMP